MSKKNPPKRSLGFRLKVLAIKGAVAAISINMLVDHASNAEASSTENDPTVLFFENGDNPDAAQAPTPDKPASDAAIANGYNKSTDTYDIGDQDTARWKVSEKPYSAKIACADQHSKTPHIQILVDDITVVKALYNTGFRGKALTTFASLAYAEGLKDLNCIGDDSPKYFNKRTPNGQHWDYSAGLWQQRGIIELRGTGDIRDTTKLFSAKDPVASLSFQARAAWETSEQGTKIGPWSATHEDKQLINAPRVCEIAKTIGALEQSDNCQTLLYRP